MRQSYHLAPLPGRKNPVPNSAPPIKKGNTRYTVRYATPASSVTLHGAPVPPVVGAAVIAINNNGHPIAP